MSHIIGALLVNIRIIMAIKCGAVNSGNTVEGAPVMVVGTVETEMSCTIRK